MVSYGLFDKGLYEKHSILTSKDIQQRYLIAKAKLDKNFLTGMPYVLIDNQSIFDENKDIAEN